MSANQNFVYCPNCGSQNRAEARVCKQCGNALAPVAPPEQTAKTAKIPAPADDTQTRKVKSPKEKKAGATRWLGETGFAPLPERARVNQRYEILQVFASPPEGDYYTYLVVDEQSSETAPQTRILWEARELERYAREATLLGRQLKHRALFEVSNRFEFTPYEGRAREYIVTEYPIQPVTALGPLGEAALLKWAKELADALAFLHDNGLAHGNIVPESVIVSNAQVKLWNYATLTALTPELQKQDVHQLAWTLNALATPPQQAAPALSPGVAQIFQYALAGAYLDARGFAADLQNAYEQLRRPASVNVVVGRMTDVGMKRELNEDSLFTVEAGQFIQGGSQIVGLYVVADGMGGAAAGEIASRMVTETLAGHIVASGALMPPYNKNAEQYKTILEDAAKRANQAVFEKRKADRTDMGSTLVAALLVGNQAYVANVGDSRAYLVDANGIKKITRDHSLVQALVDQGQITEADVRTHPQRNYILRNVGDKAQIQVDLYDPTLESGQALVLCSDGLWEMMQDEDIQRVVMANATSPQKACREMIELANKNGGDDNITVIVVRME